MTADGRSLWPISTFYAVMSRHNKTFFERADS